MEGEFPDPAGGEITPADPSLRLAWWIIGRLIAVKLVPLPNLEDAESVIRLHKALIELSWLLEDSG